MMHRKAILSSRLKDDDTAFKWYLESVSVCGEGKDSLCVAEAYEQIGYLYGIKNDIDKSNDYYLLNSSRKCNFS